MNIQTALKIVIVLYAVSNLLSLGIELNSECFGNVRSVHSLSKSGSTPVGNNSAWESHTGNQRLPRGALPGFNGKQGRGDSIDFIELK